MNWESWLVPKNSLIDATTGRMLIRVCGVIASTSWVVIRSRTTRSIRARPSRTWFWISSPTVRSRRLPKWSMSSVSSGRICSPEIISSSPACSRTRYSMVPTMSASLSVPCRIGRSRPSFRLTLYRPTLARSYRFGLKYRFSSSAWADSRVGGSPGRSLR